MINMETLLSLFALFAWPVLFGYAAYLWFKGRKISWLNLKLRLAQKVIRGDDISNIR